MRENLTCLLCGTAFSAPRSAERMYCSRACYFAVRPSRVECRCQLCGVLVTLKPADIRKGGGKFCSKRCREQYARTENVILARFMEKVVISDDCWLWTAATTPKKGGRGGYGKFYMAGRLFTASRASWLIHNGPIKDGLFVCHNCPGGDNPRCVRPDHLFLGTAKENSEDMVMKGRSAVGDRNGSRTKPEAWSHLRASRQRTAP